MIPAYPQAHSRAGTSFSKRKIHVPGRPTMLLGRVPQLHDGVVRRRQQATARDTSTATAASIPPSPIQETHGGNPSPVGLEVHQGSLVLLLLFLELGFLGSFVVLFAQQRKLGRNKS